MNATAMRTRILFRLRVYSIAFATLGAFASVATAQTRAPQRRYTFRVIEGEIPSFEIRHENQLVFRLPVISGLSTPGAEEKLSGIRLIKLPSSDGQDRWEVTADSSLWTERKFVWTFGADHIEYQQFATGSKAIERCYFFSNGISAPWANGTSPGVFANSTIYASRYFSPQPNHADQYYFGIAVPQSVGVLEEQPPPAGFHPELMTGLFAPPPLFLAFKRGGSWAGVGLGDKPGKYLFNALEYSGSKYAGASFWVNYAGYRSATNGFESPTVAIYFGYSEYDALSQYVSWVDQKGFGTASRFPHAPWHYRPIFCGWAEQTREASTRQIEAHDLATQADYERWIAVIESRGLPAGTIVIDDKWQSQYGTFDVDERKWPDLKGFITRQHAKGRHVLLWVPAFHREGLPPELTVKEDDRAIAGDVSNPAYEEYLRGKIRHLVADLGVDGFKEDWIGGVSRSANLKMHAPLFGIEFVRRFQFILYDEAHKQKPDALIETQTPNPLFRESSDVLRLNDIWYGARHVPEMMRRRARIAKIAGWDLVDCDNASSTNLEEWWDYMQQQPSIGIPALYFVYRTETTMEEVPEDKWRQLAEIWTSYVRQLEGHAP
jgi:hypothetical protein